MIAKKNKESSYLKIFIPFVIFRLGLLQESIDVGEEVLLLSIGRRLLGANVALDRQAQFSPL